MPRLPHTHTHTRFLRSPTAPHAPQGTGRKGPRWTSASTKWTKPCVFTAATNPCDIALTCKDVYDALTTKEQLSEHKLYLKERGSLRHSNELTARLCAVLVEVEDLLQVADVANDGELQARTLLYESVAKCDVQFYRSYFIGWFSYHRHGYFIWQSTVAAAQAYWWMWSRYGLPRALVNRVRGIVHSFDIVNAGRKPYHPPPRWWERRAKAPLAMSIKHPNPIPDTRRQDPYRFYH